MTIHFTLNCELTINNFELTGLEEIHNSHHKADVHQHSDDNSLESLKGDAALKFDCELNFDMSPEELKSCHSMIESIGGKFADIARKSKDLGERVCSKINQDAEEPKPKFKSVEDEVKKDSSSFEIEVKAEMKKAAEIISDEESKTEPEIEQIDWARLKLDSVARTLRRAQREDIDIKPELLSEYRALRQRLAALNEKC